MHDAAAAEYAADDGDRGGSAELPTGGRRLTYRQARPWLRRPDVIVGVRPCGMEVRWVSDEERTQLVARWRHAEGKDCNVAGDVLLYRGAGEVTVVVVEEPS